MGTVIFILIAVIIISATLYFALRKSHCSSCHSTDVTRTGNKMYKEDPVAIWGSPSSYHQLEYKCNKCDEIFWEKQKAVIFN
ncbi:MAG: hypothetical protein M0Q21_07160 [Ignavibacteriaceae bacterium]|nr:hypothetical protein [Ignavibacteriaceae bacterium]